jgi:hypothetical protein
MRATALQVSESDSMHQIENGFGLAFKVTALVIPA